MKEGDIWSGTLDDDHTWQADVNRVGSYRGVLTVTRIADNEEILHEDVVLDYGAIFGPDIADVQMWTVMVIEAIDHYNAQQKAEGEST